MSVAAYCETALLSAIIRDFATEEVRESSNGKAVPASDASRDSASPPPPPPPPTSSSSSTSPLLLLPSPSRTASQLFNIGSTVGRSIALQIGTKLGRSAGELEAVKLAAKEGWTLATGRPVSSLKTNKMGLYVLEDNDFSMLRRITHQQCQQAPGMVSALTAFHRGYLAGILAALGYRATVTAEVRESPLLAFTVRIQKEPNTHGSGGAGGGSTAAPSSPQKATSGKSSSNNNNNNNNNSGSSSSSSSSHSSSRGTGATSDAPGTGGGAR